MKNLIGFISFLLLFLIGGLIFFMIPGNVNESDQIEKESTGWCGTSSPFAEYNSTNPNITPKIGKKLFKMNCAKYHAKNMKTDATGPALGGTFKLWNKDTLQYQYYINNNFEKFSPETTIRVNGLLQTFGNDQNAHHFELNKDEIASLLLYIEYI